MFGYVKPYQPELRLRELEEYKAVYCGLCKELGRNFGIFARFTLSYDFAFLAMLLISLDEDMPCETERCSCIAHPLRKHCRCRQNSAIAFSAKTAMVLTYYKLLDDISDRGLLKKLTAVLILPFAKSARKKALFEGGELSLIDKAAADMMKEQASLEKESCAISDKAAEPTAKFLQTVLESKAESPSQKEVLARFGYLFGRYIYLCDALDDLDDDRKKGNYNPFVFGDGEAVSEAKSALFHTVSELSDDLDLLELHKYKEILENILHLGLKAEVERIIEKKGGEPDGTKSL